MVISALENIDLGVTVTEINSTETRIDMLGDGMPKRMQTRLQ